MSKKAKDYDDSGRSTLGWSHLVNKPTGNFNPETGHAIGLPHAQRGKRAWSEIGGEPTRPVR